MKATEELRVPVRRTTEARRRCQWEAQETTCEEEEDEGDGRAEGASAVDNGSKAAMPVGGSGNNM